MKKQDDRQADEAPKECRQFNSAIETGVMNVLGRPSNLQRVQVQQVWQDHYRVNIFVGADAVSATVAHSYFLVTDDSGKIVRSTPAIGKQY